MEPHGSRRHCERCCTSVHDLGAMTRTEAHDLLRQHQGQELCVLYRTDAEGTLRAKAILTGVETGKPPEAS